jgi:predicted  nucleic acid-binding Zn-ribbon protein
MARLTLPSAGHASTLAIELEQQRLAHRAARIRRALSAMRRLADARRDDVPTPLRLGMSDFDRELSRVEQRMKELGGSGALL